MTFATRGGPANSGTKRPLRDKHPDWVCPVCGKYNLGRWVRCLHAGCNEKRPS